MAGVFAGSGLIGICRVRAAALPLVFRLSPGVNWPKCLGARLDGMVRFGLLATSRNWPGMSPSARSAPANAKVVFDRTEGGDCCTGCISRADHRDPVLQEAS